MWTTLISLRQKIQYERLRKHILGSEEATGYAMMLPLQLNVLSDRMSIKEMLAPLNPKNYITIMVANNHLFSRDFCHIRSANPDNKPILDPKYLSHPLEYIETVVKTEPLSSLLKPSGRLPEGKEASTLEAAKKIVKDRLLSVFHPVGTYAMMPRESGGVVDSKWKVHGTMNLKGIDASVFPMETLGNT